MSLRRMLLTLALIVVSSLSLAACDDSGGTMTGSPDLHTGDLAKGN